MSISTTALPRGDINLPGTYDHLRFWSIIRFEEGPGDIPSHNGLPYDDGIGNATIGAGFNLRNNPLNVEAVIRAIVGEQSWLDGAATNGELLAAIGGICNGEYTANTATSLNAILSAYYPGHTFSLTLDQTKSAFQTIAEDHDNQLNLRLGAQADGSPWVGPSYERIALLSLHFNLPSLIGPSLQSAIRNGNRAEAWFQIRYASNADLIQSKRRYAESTLFGLYQNPASVSEDEAESAYRMFQSHRDAIFRYEQQWEVGTRGIDAANRDFADVFNRMPDGRSQALVLREELRPAAIALTLVHLDSSKNPSNTVLNPLLIDPLNVMVADPADWQLPLMRTSTTLTGIRRNGYTVGAGDAQSELLISFDGNDILQGEGGNDALIGNGGRDTLEGGTGDDYLKGGAGGDRLRGGNGNDIYVVEGHDVEGGYDIIDDSDGNGSLFIRMEYAASVVETKIDGQLTWIKNDVWADASGLYMAVKIGTSLYITTRSVPSRVVAKIESWQSGELGITLQDKPTTPAIGVTHNGSGDNDFIETTFQATAAIASVSDYIARQSDVETAAGDLSSRSSAAFTPTARAVGGAGSDMLWGRTAESDVLEGGEGNDLLHGEWGEDELLGDGGNDFISGMGEDSVARGGDGNDVLTAADVAGLRMSGVGGLADKGTIWKDLSQFFTWRVADQQNPFKVMENGEIVVDIDFDQLGDNWSHSGVSVNGRAFRFYQDATNPARFRLEYMNNYGQYESVIGFGLVERGSATHYTYDRGVTLYGDAGDDVINGGNAGDHLHGGADNDLIAGGGGVDIIDGGTGNDIVQGGTGNDVILGDAGEDRLFGNKGEDIIEGGDGNDYLQGDDLGDGAEGAADSLDSGAGNDIIIGMHGSDVIDGGDGDDTIHGDADNLDEAWHGADTIYAGAGNDFVNGGAGNDFIDGGEGNDSLLGGKGSDFLRGGAGNDAMNGGDGNDVYQFDTGWGQDSILGLNDGAAGSDVISFGSSVSPSSIQIGVNLSGGLVLIETATGSSLTLDGVLNGSANHQIQFADGTRWTLSELRQQYASIVDGLGTTGADVIVGDIGANTIDANLGNDTVYGGSGNDIIHGGMDNEYIGTATDNDTLFGGDGDDTIDGQRGDDILHGDAGNDTLTGGDGSDALYGGVGNDTLDAGGWTVTGLGLLQERSNDLLVGGEGNDTLIGGLGRNSYVFDQGFGQDRLHLTEAQGYWASNGTPSETAVLTFREGITASSLAISMVGDDLVIGSGTDRLTIVDYNLRQGASIEFQFSDGSALSPVQQALLTIRSGGPRGETMVGGGLDDTFHGGGGDDTLRGGGGNDLFVGGAGMDTIYGGAGDDTIRYGIGDGRDHIYGNAADQSGIDTLELEAGINQQNVTLYRDGSHLYVVLNETGNYIKANWTAGAADQSIDLIRFGDGSALTAAQIEAMSLPAPPQLIYYGNTAGSPVTGNALSNDFNTISGGSASQTFVGGGGDDRYFVGEGHYKPLIVEDVAGGVDTIYSQHAYYELDSNVENLIATQGTWIYPDPRTFVGNALNNVIDVSQGGAYDSGYRLDGGAGTDILIGGVSNDTYVIDSLADQIIESPRNTSIDTVEASISYSIAGHNELENITLTGSGATTATGNALGNRLDGSSSTGANALAGGLGDDIYVVGAGDTVMELADEGVDTVIVNTGTVGAYSTAAFGNVERVVLGSATFNSSLTGGESNDDLTGNVSDNMLFGGDGHDVLRDRDVWTSYDDNDQLFGGNGNDTLISLRGNDLLVGGKGNDTLHGNTAIFAYSRGDGQDTIVGNGSAGTATLRFDATILPADVQLSRVGDALVIDIGTGGADRVTIQNYWSGETIVSPVSFIEFRNTDDSIRDSWTTASVIGRLYAVALTGGAGDDNLIGGVGYDTLIGNGGNDTLDGGAGNDILDGGAGSDTYVFDGNFGVDRVLSMDLANGGADAVQFGSIYDSSNVFWTVNDSDDLVISAINNGVFNEVTLVGFMRNGAPAHQVRLSDGTVWTAASIRAQALVATTGDDTISGFGSDDLIDGLAGNDLISGRGGNDTLRGGDGADQLYGEAGNDHLFGDAGDDSLFGGEGADILEGGLGNDAYHIDDLVDTVIEAASAGADTVHASLDYTLGNNLENLVLQGNAQRGTGNTLANRIDGNDMDNILDGSGGNDTMLGGAGNDTYIVDSSGDVVTEVAGNGTDTIQSSVTYTLSSNVENLTLTGNSSVNGTGNSLANVMVGNNGNNTLNGGGNSDTMSGGAGDDIYVVDVVGDVVNEFAGEGNDTVQAGVNYTLSANVENLTLTGGTIAISGTGNALNNVLNGNSGNNTLNGGLGNDTLNGGLGTDTLIGGSGDDIYIVDTTTDVITELAGEGIDTVSSSVTFDLTSRNNVENLTLTGGTAAINGTGNSLNNVLTGNSGNNRLTGGAGNDTLNGEAGSDTMLGGTGDDVYFVDVSTDVVTENSGEGNDTVNSAVTFNLSLTANQHIENVTLTGSGNNGITGNNLANVLIGNSGGNAISSGAGNDTLDGGAGTDTLTGGTGNDTYRMARGHGTDTVVENDATAGNYDIASFLSGIAFDQLWFRRPSGSNNLDISIIGTNDKMVLKDWYLGSQYRTEEIQVADDGRYLLAADVQTLVNAMASMTPPPLGQTTLTASQRNSLDSALTAAWKTRARNAVTSVLQAEGTGMVKPLQVFGVGSEGNVKPLQVSGFDSRQMTRWNWSDGRNRITGAGHLSGDWLRHRLFSEIRWGEELSLQGLSTTLVGSGYTATCQLPPASIDDEDRRRPFDLDGWMVDHTPTGDEDRRRLSDLDGWMVDHTPMDEEDRRRLSDLDGWMVDHTPTDDEDRRRPFDLDAWMVDASRSRRIPTDCGKSPLVSTCAKPPGANAVVVSNCRRLIDLMALSEGNEREVEFMSLNGRGQPDRWVP
jgi:Ca2+-binding RTX toxin-like protein